LFFGAEWVEAAGYPYEQHQEDELGTGLVDEDKLQRARVAGMCNAL